MLALEGVTKRFGETAAVEELTLEVREGELLTLLGPSGCGKTTTLRMIAGFETPSAGRLRLKDAEITKQPPQERGFGMVFQNYALFPHLDVHENVAFGLKVRGFGKQEMRRRVDKALELVDLEGLGKRRVQALSGGQQQRVALARALAPEPPVLLLDEPLSNLDASLRERTRTELRALLTRLGITSVFVTHDQEEAFALSDRVAVMRAGRLEQLAEPEALYQSPATPFVASFLGRANFLPARAVAAREEGLLCELDGGVRWLAATAGGAAPGTDVRLMIRPEEVRLSPLSSENVSGVPSDALQGEVVARRFAGALTHYTVRAGRLELIATGAPGLSTPGARVMVRPADGARVRAFAGEAAAATSSETVDVAAETP